MNLSFAGCGFLGIYHVGVASCFREYAPHVLVDKIAGASVGSIAACALLSNVSLGQTTTDVLNVAVKARARALGPLHPGFDLNKSIRDGLEKGLPDNAHLLCSGRLFISVTRFSDGENVLLSHFDSKEDLIQALLCSCFIPFYSGLIMPKFHGTTYVDGGFSDNLPVLDDNTVTVSPFAGEHDICPQDDNCNILQISLANTHIAISAKNIYRFIRILFPPHPEILSKMCQQGFDDALKFLQRHNVISCTRCMAVQSCIVVSDSDSSSESEVECTSVTVSHPYDDCVECRYRKQTALLDKLPDSVVKAIQEACDQVNKGVINWLFRHRPIKLISWLGLPYVLPIDLSIVFFCKLWETMPTLQKELYQRFKSILALVRNLLKKIESNRHLCSAKFSCQLAVTEFDYTEENVSSSYIMPNFNKVPEEHCRFTTEHDGHVPDIKSSILLPKFLPHPDKMPSNRPERKSYAGFINASHEKRGKYVRRNSMVEMRQPERVLRNMKFGFTFDLASKVRSEDRKQDVIDALHSLSEGDSNFDVIDITNKALNWERECISHCHGEMESEKAETLDKILEVTSNEAVMSYYYMDDKSFKVTEIYNVDDADTSAVLSSEENELNKNLQWENDWVMDGYNEIPYSQNTNTVTDTFDDDEFDMSDNETELNLENDTFLDTTQKEINSNINDSYNVQKMPKRKMSFIVVNK